MKKNEDDLLKRNNTTHDCIIRNEASWLGNSIMQGYLDRLHASNVYIHAQHVIQMKGSKDETLMLKIDRDELLKILIKVKNGEIAYASHTKDFTRFNAVNKSDTEVKGLKENDLWDYATIVYDWAISLGLKLNNFNIFAVDAISLKSKLDLYIAAVGGKRNVETTDVVATANIARELNVVGTMLREEVDPFVETFIDIAPAFVSEYKSARKIIHYGVRHLLPECTMDFKVSDANTTLDLRLVMIVVEETNDKALTDDTGATSLKLAKAGVYTLTITKPNYEILIMKNVEIGVGDVLVLNIKLVPIVIITE